MVKGIVQWRSACSRQRLQSHAHMSEESTGATLRRIFDDGSMERVAEQLRQKIVSDPDSAELLEQAANLERQLGHLERSARCYASLARLDKEQPEKCLPDSSKAAALMENLPIPAIGDQIIPFGRLRNFLPQAELDALRCYVADHQDEFEQTAVLSAGAAQDHYDHSTRESSHLSRIDPVLQTFLPRFVEALPILLSQMGMASFPAEIQSCKISAYHDGHFFGMHQDRNDGAAASRRLGFIYYFHFDPQAFRGGELVLYDTNLSTMFPGDGFTTVKPELNSLLLVPSHCWHEVLPVVCKNSDWQSARFTLSGWIHDEEWM